MNDSFREFFSYPRLFAEMFRHKNIIGPEVIRFGSDPRQRFLHFSPSEKLHDEVIIYIHGGGWNSNSPGMFRFVGDFFASQGYECILPGYRIVPGVRYSGIIDDIFRGYRSIIKYLKQILLIN